VTVDTIPLSYNKDLAYLQGKLDTITFLDRVRGNKQALRKAFKGKYDPSNHRQDELAETYLDD
jgi:hypothetical protein